MLKIAAIIVDAVLMWQVVDLFVTGWRRAAGLVGPLPRGRGKLTRLELMQSRKSRWQSLQLAKASR